MHSVLDRLVENINSAAVDPLPSENFYTENVFPTDVYAEILARLPPDEAYEFIEHPDAVLPDGTITRKLVDLTSETIGRFKQEDQAFWQSMHEILVSQTFQQAVLHKFRDRLNQRFGTTWPELVTVPIFYRDYPGYRISEHTDAPYKVATMQFYFPENESQIHLGTSFHLRIANKFHLLKTNAFKPNSAYGFVRTDCSWHSVKQLGPNETVRNTLALTIYEKGKEYHSSKNYT